MHVIPLKYLENTCTHTRLDSSHFVCIIVHVHALNLLNKVQYMYQDAEFSPGLFKVVPLFKPFPDVV